MDYNRFPLEKDKIKTRFNADGSLKETEVEDEDKPNDSYNAILDTAYFYKGGELHFKPLWAMLEEDKEKTKLLTPAGKDPNQELEDEEKEQTTLGAALSNKHHSGSGIKLELDLSYMTTEEDKDKSKRILKGKAGVFTLDKTEFEKEDKEDEFWQLRSKLTVPIETGLPQTLKTGFHLRFRERFRSKSKVEVGAKDGKTTDKTEPKDNYRLEEDYYAGFVQDEFFLTPSLSWGTGVRAEYVELESVSGAGVRRTATFTDINPSTHLLYQLSCHLSLNAAVSRSVNRPKYDEIAPFETEKRTNSFRETPTSNRRPRSTMTSA